MVINMNNIMVENTHPHILSLKSKNQEFLNYNEANSTKYNLK